MIRLAFLAAALVAAPCRAEYTRRERNELRGGPGNYYPVLAVMPKGAAVSPLESQGGWVRLKGGKGRAGWLSKNCLVDKAPVESVEKMKFQAEERGSGTTTTAAAVAAAVRGFAQRFGRAKPADLSVLEKIKGPFFSASEFRSFKDALAGGEDASDKTRALSPQYEPRLEEEGVGLGIASAVAAKGLDNDAALRKYVNLVATVLAEGSGAYDYSFKVYVTRGREVNALAVPGGYVFVSRGLVAACRDEAELAAAIAHELTHIILRHGLKEIQHRKVQIAADAAMDELDAAAGHSPDAEEIDLETLAEDAYSAIHKPRLASYEEEADRGAAVLLARAGYDPGALPRMIGRAGEAAARAQDPENQNPFLSYDFKDRREKAEAFLRRELPSAKGATEAARFAAAVGTSR
jgi:Zn-dependent protease with chaperone function